MPAEPRARAAAVIARPKRSAFKYSPDLARFASLSGGLSARDIKEVCEHAERRWVAKIIRQKTTEQTPPIDEYLGCMRHRIENYDGEEGGGNGNGRLGGNDEV